MRRERRYFLQLSIAALLSPVDVFAVAKKKRSMEQWMTEATEHAKAVSGSLNVSRFVEPIYFLTKPIKWSPNPGQEKYRPVEVPVGFVTDFASIPRIFWSILRPDGEYTYPAIVHDYLYWFQDRSEDDADQILKMAMEDFDLDKATINAIYEGVRLGGHSAWKKNKKDRDNGERRILKRFPEDPRTRWSDWKKQPDVFAD